MTRGKTKTREGVVVSDAMNKTVVVTVSRLVMHPRYKKYVKRRKRFKVHDEQNECKVGDRVAIAETRPLSKQKRWRLQKIVERAV
jgi:small subunit ribosomal protein S17